MRAACLVSGFFSGVGAMASLATGSYWLALLNLAFFGLNLYLAWPSAGIKEQS